MRPVRLPHFAIALLITAALGLALGAALQDAAPAVIFVAVLGLGALSVLVFRAIEH